MIFFPFTSATGVLQERIGSPSDSTVQAPQGPAPKPNLVPVIANPSRKTKSSGVSGDAEPERGLPLTLKLVGMSPPDSSRDFMSLKPYRQSHFRNKLCAPST